MHEQFEPVYRALIKLKNPEDIVNFLNCLNDTTIHFLCGCVRSSIDERCTFNQKNKVRELIRQNFYDKKTDIMRLGQQSTPIKDKRAIMNQHGGSIISVLKAIADYIFKQLRKTVKAAISVAM